MRYWDLHVKTFACHVPQSELQVEEVCWVDAEICATLALVPTHVVSALKIGVPLLDFTLEVGKLYVGQVQVWQMVDKC